MTLKATLKWANSDSTRDLNDKTRVVFSKGIIADGLLVPVVGQLQIVVQTFTAISVDGMVVSSDAGTTLSVVPGQTSVVSILAQYNIGSAPTLSIDIHESSVFSLLVDKPYRLVVGAMTVLPLAIDVSVSDLDYSLRDSIDQITRSHFRGYLSSIVDLPVAIVSLNHPGDFYIITNGMGDYPQIYAWNGVTWIFSNPGPTIATDLAMHRANGFPNEIHLTNNQSDAALGSYGSPNAANPYVTSIDPRVPTLTEAQALPGSDGTPSTTNLYITQQYPITAPSILSYILPPGGVVPVGSTDGPFYVGNGPIGSASRFFALMDPFENRGYVTASNLVPQVSGVFKDAFLSIPLNPSVDSDALGYFTGDVYLQLVNAPIVTAFRLMYGKKSTLKDISKDFTVTYTPDDEYISALVAQSLVNIKGYPFGTLIATRENNKNLRIVLDDLQAYLGSVLDTNVVASAEDFDRLKDQPTYGASFVPNIGITPVYEFSNTGLVSTSYNSVTGQIQYASAVVLTAVNLGSLFRDGGGVFYTVVAVNTFLNTVDIVNTDTGLIPSFGTVTDGVPGSAIDDSIQVNFNPRNLLLSEMKLTFSNEVVKVNKLVSLPSEFSKPEGMVTFGVERYPGYIDPRIAFYGGWENFPVSSAKSFVRNKGASGIIDITGFFTGVALILRRKTNGPDLTVSINRRPVVATISTSGSNLFNANVAAMTDDKYYKVKMTPSPLPDSQPNNVRLTISAETSDALEIYGIELYRDGATNFNMASLESGRAFNATTLIKRDTVDVNVPVDPMSGGVLVSSEINPDRGAHTVYTLADNFYALDQNVLTTINTVYTIGAGTVFSCVANAMENYRPKDLVYLSNQYKVYTGDVGVFTNIITSVSPSPTGLAVGGLITGAGIPDGSTILSTGVSTIAISNTTTIAGSGVFLEVYPTVIEIRQIVSQTATSVTINAASSITDPVFRHLASTGGVYPFERDEVEMARYSLVNDFNNNSTMDFEGAASANRFVMHRDGLTVVSGQNLSVVSTGLNGAPKAVKIGLTGTLRFTVLCTRLDIITANEATAAGVTYTVDGSPNVTTTFIGGASRRQTLFSNSRYQTHEVVVTDPSGNLCISDMIIFGVGKPVSVGLTKTAELMSVAAYEPSSTALITQPLTFPTGGVFFESSSYISTLNGVGVNPDWAVVTDYTKQINGRYINTENDGAFAEFYFLGDAFELQYVTGPDHGIFTVTIDATPITALGGAIVGNHVGATVDAYSAIYDRSNIGLYNSSLAYGYHQVRMTISNLRTNNISSSGYKMAFVGYYITNANSCLTYGIDRGGSYTGTIDARDFMPLNPEDTPQVVNVTGDRRAGKFSVPNGATAVVVTFTSPLSDANYIVTPIFYNTVDIYPEFQPIVITSQTASGFTASWNSPLTTANVQIGYLTEIIN